MRLKCLLPMVVAGLALSSLAHATDGFFDSNGVKIRYVTEGEGEPVVLLHGWMGDSSMWGRDSYGDTKLSALPGFQVIAMDCRGHGKSDKPHDQAKYGVEMAADVVRLLDHLKIKKAHFVTYSMGAFIVGKVASTHSDRVLSVVYGGQAPILAGGPSGGSSEVEIFAKAVDEGKGLGPYIIAVSPANKKPTLEQANAIAKIAYGGKDVKAFAVAGLSLGKLRVTVEELKKCKAPTLFVHGENESDYVKNCVAMARKVLPNSVLKTIEGGDHVTTLAKPDFGKAVVEFLIAHRTGK